MSLFYCDLKVSQIKTPPKEVSRGRRDHEAEIYSVSHKSNIHRFKSFKLFLDI